MASSSEQPRVVLRAQAKTDALIHRLEVSHDGSRLGATGLLAILADASKAAQEGQISEAMHVKVIRSVTESVGLHCSAQPEIANVLANLLKTIDDSPRGAQFPSAQALAARGLIDLLPKLTASTQVDILAQLRTVGNRSFSDVGHGAFFDELRPIAAALPDQEKSQVYASMLRQLPDMPEAHRVHIFKSIMESVDHMSSESRANVYAEAAPALEHIRSDLKPLGFADILAETQKLELCDQAKPLTHLINSITYIDQRDHRSFYLSECLLKINTLPHEARRKPIGAAIEAVLELPGSERKESLNELLSVISDQAPSKAAIT